VQGASAIGVSAEGFSAVTLDTLAGPLTAGGSSTLRIASAAEGSGSVVISGFTDAKVGVWTAPTCSITASSSGAFKVSSGHATNVTVAASNSATVAMGSLQADTCKATLHNFGEVTGMIVDTLSLQATDSSTFKSTVSKMLLGHCQGFATVTIKGKDTANVSSFTHNGMCDFSERLEALSRAIQI
jgi:hypothetical protein